MRAAAAASKAAGTPPPPANPLNESRNSRTIASCSTAGVGLVTITVTSFVRIFFALFAYFNELSVSSNWSDAGLTAQIIAETDVPESESRSSRVSFESRYGV